MLIEPKDYVLVANRGKSVLIRVSDVVEDPTEESSGKYEGSIVGRDGQAVEFEGKEVSANMGRSPKVGKAYGVSVEPRRRAFNHDFFGEVQVFRAFSKKGAEQLDKALDDAAESLGSKYPTLNLITEIRQTQGKYAGYYKYFGGTEDKPDRLCVRPEDDFQGFQMVASHEYAHGLWFNHMTPKSRMRWIKLYLAGITLNRVKRDELETILNAVVEHGRIAGYVKEADPREQMIVRAALKQISSNYSLKSYDLQMMIDMQEDLSELWPKSLELSEKELFFTAYAQKSAEELFAECFAYSHTGHKLPKTAKALLDRTLANLTA